jgi:hypothetical protein
MFPNKYNINITVYSITLRTIRDSYSSRDIYRLYALLVNGLYRVFDIGNKYRSLILVIINNTPGKV